MSWQIILAYGFAIGFLVHINSHIGALRKDIDKLQTRLEMIDMKIPQPVDEDDP